MILRIIIGVAVIVGGIYLLFLGTVFIITSGDEVARFERGTMLILAGLTAGGVGIYLFRESAAASPEKVKKKILKLAAQKQWEISEEVLRAEIGNNEAVDTQLKLMINSGIVKKTIKGERIFYKFSEFNK